MTIREIKDTITRHEQEQGFYESVWVLVMEAIRAKTETSAELTVDDEIFILGGLAERRNNAINSQKYYTDRLTEKLESAKVNLL